MSSFGVGPQRAPDVAVIVDLYCYDAWANSRVLDAVSVLTSEEFVRTVPSSYSSVRDTLVHILWGEWIWLQRWRGRSPPTVFDPGDFADVSALRARWEQLEAERMEFLGALTGERLAAVVSYVNLRGETWEYALWKQMLHVVNHSSYHRGQITTLLRHLGAEPCGTDLLIFYDEAGTR